MPLKNFDKPKTKQMKDYLLLMRGTEAQMSDVSEQEMKDHVEKWNSYMGQLAKGGFLVGGFPLARDGRLMTKNSVTEAVSFSDKGEVVGGYLLIKARDYNHAVELTKECPLFDYDGNIEIREAVPM